MFNKAINPETEKILSKRFGKNNVIALVTAENGIPFVRYANAYYEDSVFCTITYALSNKMKHIVENPIVAITGEWFTAHGRGFNLGWFGKAGNQVMTDGLLLSQGTKYEI